MVASPPKVLVASQHARQPPSRGLGPDPAVPSKQERSLPHNAHEARTASTHGRGCDGAQPSSRGGE